MDSDQLSAADFEQRLLGPNKAVLVCGCVVNSMCRFPHTNWIRLSPFGVEEKCEDHRNMPDHFFAKGSISGQWIDGQGKPVPKELIVRKAKRLLYVKRLDIAIHRFCVRCDADSYFFKSSNKRYVICMRGHVSEYVIGSIPI